MPRRTRGWLALTVAALAAFAVYRAWKPGTPYQDRYWSPNGRWYVQKYRNWRPSLMPVGPGQGSDAISGYVRLFDKNGHMLRERFIFFSEDVRPVWSGKRVYLLGVPEMEDKAPWLLPDSSE